MDLLAVNVCGEIKNKDDLIASNNVSYLSNIKSRDSSNIEEVNTKFKESEKSNI
jgi:hypothetical protein